MPAFLALQCYNCNMMQVKQEKKSSNKWVCSLCNENQSVRKVYASSMAARDIRMFVQEYNLSRNSARDHALADIALNEGVQNDANPFHDDGFHDVHGQLHSGVHFNESNQSSAYLNSKWSEYLTQGEINYGEVAGESEEDLNLVTTVPETYSKKSKRRNSSARAYAQQRQERKRPANSKRFFENVNPSPHCPRKENTLSHFWRQKSSLVQQAPDSANSQNAEMLSTCEMLERPVEDLPLQTRADLFKGNASLHRTNLGNALVQERKFLSDTDEPSSRYRDRLHENGQGACASAKEQKHVSKWSAYLDADEVTLGEGEMQSSGLAAKWGTTEGADEGSKPPTGGSSIWSLRATSNSKYIGNTVMTNLDELNLSREGTD
ncbi:hypothetical protein KP509_14G018100 [Ceratopteris richardii]|uniref:MRN complex-interacting protein N-terminal domain-containing protein n=1 Tax=Ceratopteris richardii TaxID=49495 RepID=A0A8T2T603_CERRI|nr:hypothetical protein KP509_14G018100 [Ceratopteris richardii]